MGKAPLLGKFFSQTSLSAYRAQYEIGFFILWEPSKPTSQSSTILYPPPRKVKFTVWAVLAYHLQSDSDHLWDVSIITGLFPLLIATQLNKKKELWTYFDWEWHKGWISVHIVHQVHLYLCRLKCWFRARTMNFNFKTLCVLLISTGLPLKLL